MNYMSKIIFMNTMIIMNIKNNMNNMNIMNIMNITAWMAMAGAVLVLVFCAT